jgi:hypothetical protein
MTPNELSEMLGPAEKISAIIVAVAAMVALYQLVLAKNIAQISAKRDAFKIAAEQCQIFASEIMPLYNKFYEELKSKKLNIREKTVVTHHKNGFTLDFSKLTKKDLAALSDLNTHPGEVLNRFEAFALYFTSGVAAEKPAFLTLGCAYCDLVDAMLPFIGLLSDDDPSYENVKMLYNQWRKRREKLQMTAQKAAAEAALAGNQIQDIKTIGAN